MKRAVILPLFALMAITLFGCQPEKEAVDAEEVKNETEGEMALLMDTKDTHTIYTVTPGVKGSLAGLINR